MIEPWNAIAIAVTAALYAAASVACWRRWITRRTSVALWAAGSAVQLASAIARGSWWWVVLDAAAMLVLAWVWWDERPATHCPCIGCQPSEEPQP